MHRSFHAHDPSALYAFLLLRLSLRLYLSSFFLLSFFFLKGGCSRLLRHSYQCAVFAIVSFECGCVVPKEGSPSGRSRARVSGTQHQDCVKKERKERSRRRAVLCVSSNLHMSVCIYPYACLLHVCLHCFVLLSFSLSVFLPSCKCLFSFFLLLPFLFLLSSQRACNVTTCALCLARMWTASTLHRQDTAARSDSSFYAVDVFCKLAKDKLIWSDIQRYSLPRSSSARLCLSAPSPSPLLFHVHTAASQNDEESAHASHSVCLHVPCSSTSSLLYLSLFESEWAAVTAW